MYKSNLLTFLFLFIAAFSFGQNDITIASCADGTTESCKNNAVTFTFKSYGFTGDGNGDANLSASVSAATNGGNTSDITVSASKSGSDILIQVTNVAAGAVAADYSISLTITDADGATNTSSGCGFITNFPNGLVYTVGTLTVLADISDQNNLSDQVLSSGGTIQMSEIYNNTDATTAYVWTVAGTTLATMTGDGQSGTTNGIAASGTTLNTSYETSNISEGVTLVKITIENVGGTASGSFPVNISGTGPCGVSASTSMATVVLPVEFMYIKANQLGNAVKLDWATASELNNEAFYIERSVDGANFVEVGMVKGAGTSVEVLEYNFVDNAPATGTNYYRIRQVDFDGSMELSEVVEVKVAKSTFLVNVNPTAASNEVQIVLGTSYEQDLTVQIFDALGRNVMNTAINAGNNVLPVDVSAFQSGTYFIKLYNDSQAITKTFVKL